MKYTIFGQYIACKEECPHSKECANHDTAGDFRSEDGMTPNITLDDNDELQCDKNALQGHGAVLLIQQDNRKKLQFMDAFQ